MQVHECEGVVASFSPARGNGVSAAEKSRDRRA